MTGQLVALTPKQLQWLINEPSKVEDFIDSETPKNEKKPTEKINIQKAWHGIHFLLTGESYSNESPLAMTIFGGTEISKDLEYSTMRYLTPEQVHEIATALRDVSKKDLAQGYVPSAFEENNIYPTEIWESEGDKALEYLLHYYELTLAFYQSVSSRGDAVILYIS
ncbi:YfbM family protein [Lusitaniella coriacea]|uniref:YfbM family protein n=1 Tax=Lusitaniella coriacea TaxID=1983105 RepID=UPI003CFB3D60